MEKFSEGDVKKKFGEQITDVFQQVRVCTPRFCISVFHSRVVLLSGVTVFVCVPCSFDCFPALEMLSATCPGHYFLFAARANDRARWIDL